MSSAPMPDEIARDACWLAQALDPSAGMTRMVAMDREAYRRASFLDDRLIQQAVDAQLVPWPEVETAMDGELRQDARWIFHTGHVGSTLVSRLLGELPQVLAVREPRLLRDLAMSPAEVRGRYCAATPKLMSRTFGEREFACVKATSFASEIASELVPPGQRALFLYASVRNYVGTILAGENSVRELRFLEDSRMQRLAGRGIALPAARNDAERAAAAWACEMIALHASADAMPDRQVTWCDFDAMLGDVAGELERVAWLLGFDPASGQLDAIVAGPLLSRYSKALEYDYSPDLRRELIAEATAQHAAEIDSAIAMLEAAADKAPLLRQAIS